MFDLRSEITAILIAHIASGVIAILMALIAVSTRKGSTPHRVAGTSSFSPWRRARRAWLGYNAKPRRSAIDFFVIAAVMRKDGGRFFARSAFTTMSPGAP